MQQQQRSQPGIQHARLACLLAVEIDACQPYVWLERELSIVTYIQEATQQAATTRSRGAQPTCMSSANPVPTHILSTASPAAQAKQMAQPDALPGRKHTHVQTKQRGPGRQASRAQGKPTLQSSFSKPSEKVLAGHNLHRPLSVIPYPGTHTQSAIELALSCSVVKPAPPPGQPLHTAPLPPSEYVPYAANTASQQSQHKHCKRAVLCDVGVCVKASPATGRRRAGCMQP